MSAKPQDIRQKTMVNSTEYEDVTVCQTTYNDRIWHVRNLQTKNRIGVGIEKMWLRSSLNITRIASGLASVILANH